MDVGACHTNRHGETSLSRAPSVTRASDRGEGKEKEREREREKENMFQFVLILFSSWISSNLKTFFYYY